MSLNAVLSNAYSGVNTNQAALRITSNNVANANTEGYARQEAGISARVAGGRGAGVSIEEITRVVDEFLEAAEGDAISAAEEASIVRSYHDRIQSLIGRPDSDTSLTARLDATMASLSTVTLDASDSLRRQSLISDLESFLSEINRLSTDIDGLRVEASNQMSEQVAIANQKLEQIARLNPQIAKSQLGQGESGALVDQRDRAIRELSEIIDVRVTKTGNGAVQISTADGVTLLDDRRRLLTYSSPGAADSFTEFDRITIQRVNPLTGALEPGTRVIDDSLGGGKLQGLVNVRDKELPDISATLGELARVFADQINALHNENASVPAPSALVGRATGLIGSDLANMTGEMDVAIVDAGGTLVTKVNLNFDTGLVNPTMTDVINAINAGLGASGVASLAADGSLSISASGIGDGVVVASDDANPAMRAGRSFAHFFGLNDLVVAQQPTHFDTGFDGTDAHNFTVGQSIDFEVRGPDGRTLRNESVSVVGTTFDDILSELNNPIGLGGYYTFSLDPNGALQAQPVTGFGEISLITSNDTTARLSSNQSFSELFGLRKGTKASHADGLRVRDSIQVDPEFLSLGKFDRNANAGERALTVGDSRGAAELSDMQLSQFSFDAAGGLQPLNTTISQYAAYVVGNAAIMAETASAQETDTRALQTSVSERRQDVSGVNIDEELAQMVVFQNAYNASARLISTVRQMFDELLSVV
ncbi:MAG: flagellar hook-associated protein FlgK [Pseudomonadota bacterium]